MSSVASVIYRFFQGHRRARRILIVLILILFQRHKRRARKLQGVFIPNLCQTQFILKGKGVRPSVRRLSLPYFSHNYPCPIICDQDLEMLQYDGSKGDNYIN